MADSFSVERRRLMLAYGAKFVLTPRAEGVELRIENLSKTYANGVRALAYSGPERLKLEPEIPTTRELGIPQVNFESWFAMYAPRKRRRRLPRKSCCCASASASPARC